MSKIKWTGDIVLCKGLKKNMGDFLQGMNYKNIASAGINNI